MSEKISTNVRGDSISDYDAMRDFLWGSPAGGPGLVYLVEKNSESIGKLAQQVGLHHGTLYGNGSGTKGLKQRVDEAQDFIASTKDNQKWLIRLLVTQVVLALVGGAWILIRAAGG